MARKLYTVEEAAKVLGVTADTLNDMRLRQEIAAYRDGTNWKFKAEEVDRLLADRGAGDSGPTEFAELDDNIDSILLSEQSLGSAPSTSSTVIGKSNEPNAESDIQIADPSKPADSRRDTSMSDVRLDGGSDIVKPGSGLSAKFDDLDSLDLDLPNPAASGILGGSGPLELAASDLSLDTGDMALGEEPKSKGSSDLGGLSSLSGGGSAINLTGADEDDDFVLGGTGSDVTLSAGDSGISLLDPTDSGLSLEEAPLELGGSAVESLELGEDDMILLEEDNDSEGATQLKADDDFLLTPLDESGGEESDSGSQVIALDSEVGDFDESAATMLGSKAPGGSLLEEDMGDEFEPAGVGGMTPGMMPANMLVPATIEAPYSAWNVVSLTFCLLFLIVTGMMMFDLLRNMWSWNEPYRVNSSLMDMIMKWFEG